MSVLRVAPLPGTFMITSIVGFLISSMYVMDLSKTWGFTFALVFVLMFIASFISMSRADAEEQLHLDALRFHNVEGDVDFEDVPSRKEVERMTKDEIKEFASEKYGIELSTDDLKREMIDQFFEELES